MRVSFLVAAAVAQDKLTVNHSTSSSSIAKHISRAVPQDKLTVNHSTSSSSIAKHISSALKNEDPTKVQDVFGSILGTKTAELKSLGSSGVKASSLKVVTAGPNCCVNFGCQLSPLWIEIFGLAMGESAVCVATNVLIYDVFCTYTPPTPAPPAPTPVWHQCQNSFECPTNSNCAYGMCIPMNVIPTPGAKGCTSDQQCGLGGRCRKTWSIYDGCFVGSCSANPNTLPCGGCPVNTECQYTSTGHVCVRPTPAPTPVTPQCQNSFECPANSNCAYGMCIPMNVIPTPGAKGCTSDQQCGLGGRCRKTWSIYDGCFVGSCSANPNTLPCGGCPVNTECRYTSTGHSCVEHSEPKLRGAVHTHVLA